MDEDTHPWSGWRRPFADRWRFLALATICLTGFFVPIDATGIAIGSVLYLVVWIASGRVRTFPALVRREPMVQAALLLYLLLLVGVFYSAAGIDDGLSTFKKYRELLLIPLFMAAVDDKRARDVAIAAFMAAVALNVVLAYGQALHLTDYRPGKTASGFLSHIVYSVFVAMFAFWAAHRAVDAGGWRRWAWALAVALSAFHVFYFSAGRSGQVLIFGLAALFLWQRVPRRYVLAAGAALVVLVAVVFATSTVMQVRFGRGIEQLMTHEKGDLSGSVNQRIEFWRNTLTLIEQSPLVGHGTGSFDTLYRANFPDTRVWPHHPHNEYFMIALQIGVFGAALFAFVLLLQWRAAGRLDKPALYLAQGLVLAYAIDGLINSTLLDTHEGHWWAFMAGILFAPLATRAAAAPRPAAEGGPPPARIVHVNGESGLGGGERQTLGLIAGLAARGYRDQVLACRPGAAIGRAARAQGVTVAELEMRHHGDVAAAWRLRRLARQSPRTLVHAHTGRAAALAALANLDRSLALVVTRHLALPVRRRRLARWRLSRADRAVAVSAAAADRLREAGVNEDRLEVIPNFVDRARVPDVKRPAREPGAAARLLAVGLLAPIKGHDVLIRAMARLRDDGVAATLSIAGDGDGADALRALIAELGLVDRVTLLGETADVAVLLAEADLFVMPSRSESFALAAAEAMLSGLAVMASDTGGLAELIDDGRNGVLVPPDDDAALAAALAALIADPARARALGEAARRKLTGRFRRDDMAAAYDRLYRRVMAAREATG